MPNDPNCVYAKFNHIHRTPYDCTLSKSPCIYPEKPKKDCKDRIMATVERNVFDDEKYLYKIQANRLASLMHDLIASEQRRLHGGQSGRGDKATKARYDMGHYPFIARGTDYIVEALAYVFTYLRNKSKTTPSFLDCGCGIGNVVLLARKFGFSAFGIEYDEETLKRGQFIMELFGYDPKFLFQGDLLKFDRFHEFDVLYGYCPMCDPEMEHEFEDRIFLNAKVGAYFIGLRTKPMVINFDKDGREIQGASRREVFDTVYLQRIYLPPANEFGLAAPLKKVRHVKVRPTPKKTR